MVYEVVKVHEDKYCSADRFSKENHKPVSILLRWIFANRLRQALVALTQSAVLVTEYGDMVDTRMEVSLHHHILYTFQ